MKPEELERRVLLFTLLIFLSFTVLGWRLWVLQLAEGERWASLAQGQRIKKVEITAPRGEILDREGRVLAGNRPGYTVSLVYTGEPMETKTLDLLTSILSGPRGDDAAPAAPVGPDARRTGMGTTEQVTSVILRALKELRKNPLQPVEIAVDVPPEIVTMLRERMYELPGVIIEVKPIRTYPYNETAAHLLGYVSSIQEEHLKPEFQERWGLTDVGYEPNDLVGKAGVESILAFDRVLRGKDGEKLVEVDARGRPVKADLGGIEPVPGSSLRLTIDVDVQRVAEQALEKTIMRLREGLDPMDRDPKTGLPLPFGYEGAVYRVQGGPNTQIYGGAAVVIDVRTGAVLALASWPSYDPDWFSLAPHLLPGTQRKEAWREYFRQLSTMPGRPLLNRALQGLYQPGSTFKPITALAALEANRVLGKITCTGSWNRYGRVWGDWAAHGEGIGLREALRDSCNVYFYQLGDRMGIEKGKTVLVAAASQGDLVLRVRDVGGLLPGDYVYVGEGEQAELHELSWVDRENQELQLVAEGEDEGPLRAAWPEGTAVTEARNRWNNPTAWVAREFGLGSPTGIRGLPPGSESAGRVPDRRNSRGWTPGQTLNTAIGQGGQVYTPLQLAVYTAALANGGYRWVPYVVSELITPGGEVERVFEPELAGRVRISPENLEEVRRGMLAVTEPGGTAAWRFADWRAYGFPIKTAGKTGTAQVPGKISHGVYIGFAPYDNPEIAVAVVIEHGGGGSLAATPVARAIFDEYFGYAKFWESKQPKRIVPDPQAPSQPDRSQWVPPFDD